MVWQDRVVLADSAFNTARPVTRVEACKRTDGSALFSSTVATQGMPGIGALHRFGQNAYLFRPSHITGDSPDARTTVEVGFVYLRDGKVFPTHRGSNLTSGKVPRYCDVGTIRVGYREFVSKCNPDSWRPVALTSYAEKARLNWTLPGDFTVLRGDDIAERGTSVFVRNEDTGAVLDLSIYDGSTIFTLDGATDVLAVTQDEVVARCGDTTVCAFSRTTHRRVWMQADAGGSPSAIVGGSVVYLSDGLSLDATTGQVAARLPAGPFALGQYQDVETLIGYAQGQF